MFDLVPEYTGEGEKVKNPREGNVTTTGIMVSGKVVDTELLYKLAQMGASNIELADFFGVTESQIRYYFTSFLAKGRASLKLKLRRAQLKVALEDHNPTMLIFLSKSILGMTENPINTDDSKVLPWNTDIQDEDYADTTQTSTDHNS